MRVLVLEDNEARVRKFRRELVGNVVDFARDAEEALALIGARAYDLVFLDHDLGGEEMADSRGANTGYRVASLLARDGKNGAARVVLHSCNPAGAGMMALALPRAVLAPFVSLDIAAAARRAAETTAQGDTARPPVQTTAPEGGGEP
jgi:DNA-binding NarL/FixJ family response regulator